MAINDYPAMYGADPVLGNFTDDAQLHLWCAHALSALSASPEQPLKLFNDDIQSAIRYLLKCEVARAMNASRAGH